jgi:ribosome recycling factor
VRLPFPALTEDRRKDIAKNLKKIAEDAKVGLRNIRRDANEDVKKQEKDKKVTEDDRKKMEDIIQKHTDSFVKLVDERLSAKEKEVMTL